jgi:hypothetical protein
LYAGRRWRTKRRSIGGSAHSCAGFTVTGYTNIGIACANNPEPRAIAGVVDSKYSATVGIVAGAEHAVQIVAFSDYPRISNTLTKNTLERITQADDTAPSDTDYPISLGRIFAANRWHTWVTGRFRASHSFPPVGYTQHRGGVGSEECIYQTHPKPLWVKRTTTITMRQRVQPTHPGGTGM